MCCIIWLSLHALDVTRMRATTWFVCSQGMCRKSNRSPKIKYVRFWLVGIQLVFNFSDLRSYTEHTHTHTHTHTQTNTHKMYYATGPAWRGMACINMCELGKWKWKLGHNVDSVCSLLSSILTGCSLGASTFVTLTRFIYVLISDVRCSSRIYFGDAFVFFVYFAFILSDF